MDLMSIVWHFNVQNAWLQIKLLKYKWNCLVVENDIDFIGEHFCIFWMRIENVFQVINIIMKVKPNLRNNSKFQWTILQKIFKFIWIKVTPWNYYTFLFKKMIKGHGGKIFFNFLT
jgi:hypothetical protein